MTDAPDLDAQLAAIPLFSGLSKRQRAKLLDKSKVVEHHSGQEIARQGGGALAMHVVLDGAAAVTIGGRSVRTLGRGEYFGEISMIDGRPRSATVTADGTLRTLAVPHLAFTGLIENDASAAKALLVALCSRLREAEAGSPG